MTYTKHDMKEAIIRKLRLNYGCTEQQASDGEMLKACAMVLRDIMAEHGVESREKAAREGARGSLPVAGVPDGPQPDEERL